MKTLAKINKDKRVAKVQNISMNVITENQQTCAKKRRMENMAGEPLQQKKRTALGDLTNAIGRSLLGNNRHNKTKQDKAKVELKVKKEKKIFQGTVTSSQGTIASSQGSLTSSQGTITSSQGTITSSQGTVTSSQENAYVTASETSPENLPELDIIEVVDEVVEEPQEPEVLPEQTSKLPEGVTDFDAENINDPLMAPEYAMDIFNYYLEREEQFLVKPYLDRQPGITKRIRAILVDWLVELQENMELNHETLYLTVKLVDLYLEKKSISRNYLQLLGATAMFIACKYEERCPPPVSDFLFVCEDAYSLDAMLQLEMDILSAIDFEVGVPLSYRFLRRYAKVEKLGMDILTLARYVLEMSLHDYNMVFERESIKAAASLLLALRMKDRDWSAQLQYYSGYEKSQLLEMARRLNVILHNPIKDVSNVIDKYSHSIFFEVAKVPLLEENSPRLQSEINTSLNF